MEIKMEEVSLINVADGTLEAHFKELLNEAAEIFMDSEQYESNRGNVAVQIDLTLNVVYNERAQSITVYARGGMKRPKRKLAVRGLLQRAGKFFVYDEPHQQPLFDGKPLPANANGEKKLRMEEQPGS